ncbi:MAG: hypothetical protein PQJ58_02655 [Spirochaetales bacterium]|nr:hypothetical protein [Spirochaetales bacterium]
MKKTTLLFILLLILSGGFLPAQETLPRIYLQAPVVHSRDKQLQTISYSVYDTTHLILDMLGRYDIMPPAGDVTGDYSAFCDAYNIDTFIGGECSMAADGPGIELGMFVFDRKEGQVVQKLTGRAESVLDVFDEVDAMVLKLMEEFSGRHIAFGEILLENTGSPGIFDVWIDGKRYLPQENIIPKVINGEHLVQIVQIRLDGSYTVATETVEVMENETRVVSFAIPGILPSEEKSISELETFISENWEKRRRWY